MKFNGSTSITVEKYFYEGKVSRVVVKSHQNNYWIDLPVNSFWARSFVAVVIPIIKAVSTIITDLNIAVVKH
ncbi:MAG: hypothetical protein D4R68_00275 [Ignavibacteriales bacterium]|nr:MAG: hypothetical protein D4R68_00275 [Ignavibacteriales bacterium]